MNASDIVRLLNSNHYAPAELDEVNNICRNFPEFGIAHMLKVRIREVLGYEKDNELKVAAVYAMDRKLLFQLVTEVHEPLIAEPVPEAEQESIPGSVPEATGAIQFSDEANEQADVIIEQHAPYAGQETTGDLLELEDDADDAGEAEEAFEVVVDEEAVEEKEVEEKAVEEKAVEEKAEQEALEIDAEVENEQNSSHRLIQSFITEEPGVIRADAQTSLKGDVSLSSIQEHDGFITDTLAKIYVKQGLFAKAIYAYEKLSLKYPEKSAYFAAQIEKIRNINHS